MHSRISLQRLREISRKITCFFYSTKSRNLAAQTNYTIIMGYSSFSVKQVKKQFALTETKMDLFQAENISPLPPTALLTAILERPKRISLNNEKSRSEYIVAQILLEIEEINAYKISLYSGENLEADKNLGLNGECDFIFANSPASTSIESPIFCVVEAENDNINSGLGQCIAQMLGAKIYNEKDNITLPTMYGCVTTGDVWIFLKLEENLIFIDIQKYYLDNLPMILGILQYIVRVQNE